MKLHVLVASIICLTMTSCGLIKKNNTEINELLFSKWKVVEINNSKVPEQINGNDHNIIFNKSNSQYSASTGCNTLNGGYSITGNKINFSSGISTLMACQDMSLEDGLKKALPEIAKYTILENTLHLQDKKGATIVKLKLANKTDTKNLTGTWELDYLAEPGKSMQDLFQNQRPTITFDHKEKTFSGQGPCNRYSGTFTSENHKIDFGMIASTKMACPTLAGESAYFKALDKANTYSIQENTLTFIMGDIAILRFKKK